MREQQVSNIQSKSPPKDFPAARWAEGEAAIFKTGDRVKVVLRFPIGHYRVPRYIRGKTGVVEAVIEPRAVNNEEEGFGHNAGSKRHYYRVALAMEEIWQGYAGSAHDRLKIEVFESWLARA
jgi:nitrile hydratase